MSSDGEQNPWKAIDAIEIHEHTTVEDFNRGLWERLFASYVLVAIRYWEEGNVTLTEAFQMIYRQAKMQPRP